MSLFEQHLDEEYFFNTMRKCNKKSELMLMRCATASV